MSSKKLWSREELILALNLYLKLPFGKLHSGTREIQNLASLIGRSSSAVAMRLNNFAAVDPYHQNRGIKGLTGGLRQVQPIWDEFNNDKEALLFETERLLAEREQQRIEDKYQKVLEGIEHLKGIDRERMVKTRVNQNVFRQIVLANYDSKCAITGIAIPELLLASHILPWSKEENERLNPENGICLSALYDRAFDKGLIGINSQFKVEVSPTLRDYEHQEYYASHFTSIKGKVIHLPHKYYPRKQFLEYHMDTVFRR